MDQKTGMPQKWLYSNDNHWSHTEYDAIYKFYTEELPAVKVQQQKRKSQQHVPQASSSSASSSASLFSTKEQKKAVIKPTTITAANTASAAAVMEKRNEVRAEVEKVTQPPGKVAAMVEAINKKIESIRQQQQIDKPQGAAATTVKQAKNVQGSASGSVATSSESLLTSANAFRVAVGQSIISQVNEMRSFIATKTAASAPQTNNVNVQTTNKKKTSTVTTNNEANNSSLTVAKLKSRVSDITGKGVSTLADGANTIATTVSTMAVRGAAAVVGGFNTVAATAVDVAGRSTHTVSHSASAFVGGASSAVNNAAVLAGHGASAVADGASTAATAAAQVAGDLLIKTQSFTNTLGSDVVIQGNELKKAASSAWESTKQSDKSTATATTTTVSTARSSYKKSTAKPPAPKVMVTTATKKTSTSAKSAATSELKNSLSTAAAAASQQAGVFLSKADVFKNTIGDAVVNQASSFRNAANDALENTKKAITSRLPAPAAAPAKAEKKKDTSAKPVKTTSAVSSPIVKKLSFFSSSSAKPEKAPQAAKKLAQPAPSQQKQQQQVSVALLARAEAFRQTLGHAVLSQASAFKQSAIDAKNALPTTLPSIKFNSTSAAGGTGSAASTSKQNQPPDFRQTQAAKVASAKSTKTSSKTSVDAAAGLVQNLGKDVLVMKDALVAAFKWQPTTLAQANASTTTTTTSKSKEASTKSSKNGAAGGGGAATASPLWGWANIIVHPTTPSISSTPEKTSWFTGKQAATPEKTSWFPGTGTGSSSLWGWKPTIVHPMTSSTSGGGFWNPTSYFSGGGSNSAGASNSATSPQFSWSPQNFAPSPPSSSSKNAVNPQWSWNPAAFPSTPRVALIAAGLIGCAYILGAAWTRVHDIKKSNNDGGIDGASPLSSSSSFDSKGALDGGDGIDNNESSTVAMNPFSSSIYDRDVSYGPSSNLFDGPGLSGAGAATAAAPVIGRSREALIAESQRRINVAKEALAKVAEAEQMAKQKQLEQEQATSSDKDEITANTANAASNKQKKSKADSFDMFRSIIQALSSVPSELPAKYDPVSSSIKEITKNESWTGPARDRSQKPLREEKYDVVAALFSAIMQQKEPPLRKHEKNKHKNTTSFSSSWDPVAAALDAAAGWQPPQPRKTTTTSGNNTNAGHSIGDQDKYDLTASLMAGLYTINPPRMDDGGAKWDPLTFVLASWAANLEHVSSQPVSPTYDPAAGMKGAEPSVVRSKYDWAQAVLKSEPPESSTKDDGDTSKRGGKRKWLMSTLKENVPNVLNWKGEEKQEQQQENKSRKESGNETVDDILADIGSVSTAIGTDRDEY
jgi:hypothetical protein